MCAATPSAAELSVAPPTPSDIVNLSFNGSYQGQASYDPHSIQLTEQGSIVSSASLARNTPGPPPPPSSASHGGGASSISGPGQPGPSQPQPPQEVGPDSSALPTALRRRLADGDKDLPELAATPYRSESGVSALSERERQHLRNTSDPATVSTMEGVISSPPHSHMSTGHRVASPPVMEEGTMEAARASPPEMVSPPTDGTAEGEDYVGVRGMHGTVSPVEARSELPRPSSRKSVFRERAEDLDGLGRS